MESHSDHDLLVRIDEQVKQMRVTLETDRKTAGERAVKVDADFEVYKREIAARMKINEDDVNDLKTSRAKFYAVSGTIATLVSLIIKIFWK